ncbi:MAG: alpha/beta hydrolase [Chloroflexi bacterium]|nr:MAG: alpha/beta hydrolase [Chloroflexota bacterium]
MLEQIIRKQFVTLNDIRLHVITAGSERGEPIILLHGFPEFWYGWHHQIEPLASAGYHVIVPDQRGYNLSDKPKDVAAYNLDVLANDILALGTSMEYEKVALVGHDWGGAVAWWFASKYPQHVSKLIILNAPHHRVMREALRNDPAQRRRSWYMRYFQLPWLPEASMRLFNWRGLIEPLKRSAKKDTFSEEDWVCYRAAWSQPGAMTAMLNWYRALRKAPPKAPPDPHIHVPTLLLWGTGDIALGKEMAQPSIDLCDDGRLVYFENATHWLQHDEPEAVNQHILEFLES